MNVQFFEQRITNETFHICFNQVDQGKQGHLELKIYVCFECLFHWELEEQGLESFSCPKCGSRNIVGLVQVLEE